jgi:hypothetical protein
LVYFTAIWSILLPFGIFYCHLVYFTAIWSYFRAIWSILRPFGIFYCHLVYFTAIWFILLPFGLFYCHLVYLLPFGLILGAFGLFYGHLVYFWNVVPRKIWQPCVQARKSGLGAVFINLMQLYVGANLVLPQMFALLNFLFSIVKLNLNFFI